MVSSEDGYRGGGKRTGKDRDDGFVYRRDLPLLHYVTGKECHDEQHDGDKERP